jgi:predicted sugar kinase
VGRGLRSAVGTHGFDVGGLLFERGKQPHDEIAPLARRVPLPAVWRFVLVCPRERRGLHGGTEKRVFSNLPPVSQELADRLAEEVCQRMFPAAEAGDFATFSESVFDYGYQAGLCFSAFQGGAFNGREAERLVQRMRAMGIIGVGQSSWGPTIFGLCRSQTMAEEFAEQLRSAPEAGSADIWVSAACNSGASVRTLPGDS